MRNRLPLALLGLAGSLLIALVGPRLTDGSGVSWWYLVRLGSGRRASELVFYAGMVMLCAAWLALGRGVGELSPRQLWAIGALWCLPLLAGPALFSRDAYSYLAQGTIAHLGLSPYHDPPLVLGHLGHGQLLNAVGSFWRKTTAPYGPLFLALVRSIVSVTGSSLIAGVMLIRLLDLAGIVLLALFVPRLARALGADPARATWIAVLNPLVLLELIAAAHNDALLVGLMVAGVTLALERRPILGIALCAVAATIKVPAILAVAFIAVAWARTAPAAREQLPKLLAAGASAAAIIVAITIVSGLGFGWISTSVFSTPAKVQLAITPATAFGWTIAHGLRAVDIVIGRRAFERTLGEIAFVVSALAALWLLWRTRFANLVRYLALILLAFALAGPATWPWYLTWGLVLLAALPAAQSFRALAPAIAAAVFAVKPNGILALPLGSSPLVVVVYLLSAAAGWYLWRQQRDSRDVSGALAVG